MLYRSEGRKLLKVFNHLVYATDEILDLVVAEFIQPLPGVPLLALKRLVKKEVEDEVRHQQLKVCVCFRPPLSSILLEHSRGKSGDQIMLHTKRFGYRG